MNEIEFLEKCSELSAMARDKEPIPGQKITSRPQYYAAYDILCDEYIQARNHAYGIFPSKLIANNKPLQTQDEFDYIRNTYQPITKDTFIEFSNTVKRSLMNGKIVFKSPDNQLSEDYEKYLKEDLKEYQSFKLFALAMTDEKLIDANGITGVWVDFDTEEMEDEGERFDMIVGSVRPFPVMYTVEQVVYSDDNEYIVELAKRSYVKYGGNDKKHGRIYRYFGKDFLFEAKQVGKYIDDVFELSYAFDHGLGYTPASKLMGNPNIMDNELYYNSIFNIAVPHLNNAALDSANLVVIKNKSVYPTRVVVREKCDFSNEVGSCDGGQITWMDGESLVANKQTCPNCRGTGYHGVFGAMSELIVNKTPSGIDDDRSNNVTAQNAMAYVSPPIDTPKFLAEEIEKALNKSQEVLHLKAEPRSTGDISATEKNRDVKNTEAFIKPISDQIWYLVELIINSMGAIRYGVEEYQEFKPSITTPVTFDLLTPEDYLQEIKEAKEAGLPSMIVQSMVTDYYMALAKDNPDEAKIYYLAVQADRLLGMTVEEIVLGLSRGLIKPWEAVLHQSVLFFIEKAIMEDDEFLEKEVSEQKLVLETMAKAAVPQNDLELPPPAEI